MILSLFLLLLLIYLAPYFYHCFLVQAEELSKCLSEKNVPAKVYVGMRYWHPFTEEAIEQVS